MVSDESRKQFGKSLGANLRAARLARGFTQRQIAGSEFSVSYISSIERGKVEPSLLTLEILAGRLGLSSGQLLPNEGKSHIDHLTSSEAEINRVPLLSEVSLLQEIIAAKVVDLDQPLMINLLGRQQLWTHYFLVRAYLRSDRLEEVKCALSQTIKPGSELHNQYLMAQLLHLQARVYAITHNYTQAISIESDCLKLLEHVSPRDSLLLAQLHSDLGVYYFCLDKTEKAIEQFRYALSLTKGLVSSQNLQSIYWELTQVYHQAGEYYLAELYAQKCLYLQSECPSLRSEIYYYLGQEMLKGDQEKAHAFLEEALQRPNVLRDQLASASITAHLSKWMFTHGRFKEAEEYAQKALNMAQPFNDTPILAEALLTYGVIAYTQTRYEEGDSHFLAALELLDRLGLYEELRSAYKDYAQLLEQRGKEREAIIQYKRAIEISQKLEKLGR